MTMDPITQERRIRDTLQNRPAGAVDRLSGDAGGVLQGLWVCGRYDGPILGTGPFLGKSEAERHWPEAHEELRDAGLIEFRTEQRSTPGSAEGHTTYLVWNMTSLGTEVMRDLYAWRSEMRQARDADEANLAISATADLSGRPGTP